MVDGPADELGVDHVEDIDQQHHGIGASSQLPVGAQVAEAAQDGAELGRCGGLGWDDGLHEVR